MPYRTESTATVWFHFCKEVSLCCDELYDILLLFYSKRVVYFATSCYCIHFYYPGVGIWFFTKEPSNTGANSLFLDERTGEWKQENIWTKRPARSRACAVAIDDKNIAYIGGQHPNKFGENAAGVLPDDEKKRAFGQRISVYNIDTKIETPNYQSLEMKYTRNHLSCTLIPSCNGNPTVAICK